ncbi:hypothetical protein EBZU44_47470 [Enterobacter cloacae]|nr:hypothetical protein EBZU44_47470 [Enterobacter cloacae]
MSKAEMDVQRANRDSANAALQIAREEKPDDARRPFSGTAASVHAKSSGRLSRPARHVT